MFSGCFQGTIDSISSAWLGSFWPTPCENDSCEWGSRKNPSPLGVGDVQFKKDYRIEASTIQVEPIAPKFCPWRRCKGLYAKTGTCRTLDRWFRTARPGRGVEGVFRHAKEPLAHVVQGVLGHAKACFFG